MAARVADWTYGLKEGGDRAVSVLFASRPPDWISVLVLQNVCRSAGYNNDGWFGSAVAMLAAPAMRASLWTCVLLVVDAASAVLTGESSRRMLFYIFFPFNFLRFFFFP